MKPLQAETIAVLVALGISVEWARKRLEAKRIFEYAHEYHGVSPKTFLGSTTRQLSEMRFTAMWAMRKVGLSLAQIAEAFGMSDHTSIRYGIAATERDSRLRRQGTDIFEGATGRKVPGVVVEMDRADRAA